LLQIRHHHSGPTRFCDLLSSHTMRRTGISLLLQTGMPEHLVRRISGHKPGSKEFHRYVCVDQQWQDEYSDRAYRILNSDMS
jgi:integrase